MVGEQGNVTEMPLPAAGKETGKPGRPKYYPDRHMLCMEETLIEWRSGLASRIAGLQLEIEKLRGGIDQIDAELARRAALKKGRK